MTQLRTLTRSARLLLIVFVVGLGGFGIGAHAQTLPTLPQAATEAANTGGPIRLRQPQTATPKLPERAIGEASVTPPLPAPPPEPEIGEFERFVQAGGAGTSVKRLGSDLVTNATDGQDSDLSPLVPPDYLVGPGDEIIVTLWGSIDADLRLSVDRSGRIHIPRVGAVQVGGVKNSELQTAINRRIGQVFKNFESSVSLGQLRGIRVFVTGFVQRPGTYTVTSLSTVVGALMRAGGPSSAGSFRDIEVRRGSELLGKFDLYRLLLNGDRSADRTLQAGDVVHIGPVGTQVAILGSVQKPAIVELKPGETVADVLRMAGGFSAVADRTRLSIERLRERYAGRLSELKLPDDNGAPLSNGDVLRAFSAVSVALAQGKQSKRVIVEGEVARPGEYLLPENSSLHDLIKAAGGVTRDAFLFATEFTRLSVQRTQQANYERALRDMETDLARSAGSRRVDTAEDASTQAARSAGTERLIERLRTVRPTGRVILEMAVDATELPDLAIEDGDRLYIPPRPTTVGVFGSVFNAAAYLHLPGRTVGDYLRLGGGVKQGADEDSIFVVRANGSVLSGRRSSGWLQRNEGVENVRTEPGDTVFVPEEMNKTTFIQSARDWTQVLFQFGLGVAGLKSATR